MPVPTPLLAVFASLLFAAGVALAGESPAEDPALPAPAAVHPAAEVLVQAFTLLGARYQFGGDARASGFDCSGFVRHVFGEALALALPRSALGMSRLGTAVAIDALLPGDLVFFNTRKRRFSHVAIYVGDGRFIHAPSRGKRVEVVALSDPWWTRRFDGARRLIEHP